MIRGWLGWNCLLLTIFSAYGVEALVLAEGAALVFRLLNSRRQPFLFGLALALGGILAIFWVDAIRLSAIQQLGRRWRKFSFI